MKIVLTGSLGNISRPLTQQLVAKGHRVTVVSHTEDRKKEIESLGAVAAIGSLDNADFLATTFVGADAVYCMVPPAYWITGEEPIGYYRKIGACYVEALRRSRVRRVVHLSSFGAHLDRGTGFILGAHEVEILLNSVPGLAVTHIRPTSFYNNLFGFIGLIKAAGMIAANYGGDDRLFMVSPVDIAAAIAGEMEVPAGELAGPAAGFAPTPDEFAVPGVIGGRVRYVSSDEMTCNEAAAVLGRAIGKPDLRWLTISDEEMQRGLEGSGMPAMLAANLVERSAGIHTGRLVGDYERHRPVLGRVKLTDFAPGFAAAFAKNQ